MPPEYAYCARCGLPRFLAYEPTYPQPRHESSPPGRDALPVFALMAFLVAVLVVLGTFAFYLASPTLVPPGGLTVKLQSPHFIGDIAVIPVDYVSAATSPENFLVNLMVNGTLAAPTLMPPAGSTYGVLLAPAGYGYLVYWMDNDGNGALSTGDAFGIQPQGPVSPGGRFVTFLLLARDGSTEAQTSFTTPSPTMPVVNLGPVSHGTAHNAWISVASVTPPAAARYFLVQLVVGNNTTAPLPIAPSGGPAVNASVSGGEYIIAWFDVGGAGLLDAGDAFNVTLVAGAWPPANTYMALELLWNTGTILASANWYA